MAAEATAVEGTGAATRAGVLGVVTLEEVDKEEALVVEMEEATGQGSQVVALMVE